MAQSFDTVIIGCGISGASVAYHLAIENNHTNVVVLDKGSLFMTGGSTTHAPGAVLPFNLSNRLMARWGAYSADLYQSLGAYYKTGFINVARTEERIKQFQVEVQSALHDGFPAIPTLLNNNEIAAKVPGINLSDIKGGIFYPSAGRADALKAIRLMCEKAQQKGVVFRGNTNVASIVFDKKGNSRGVKLSTGELILAKNVVIAAGAWGRNLYPLPIVNIEHQWVLYQFHSNDLQGKSRAQDLPQTMPGIFDFDGGQYYTEYSGLLGIGNYNHPTIIVQDYTMKNKDNAENPFTPPDFIKARANSQNLFPTELLSERKSPIKALNGFMTYTADGFPYVGPVPGVGGLWAIECVWVTHGPGAGRTLAEWISAGKPNSHETPYIHTITPSRFPIGHGIGQSIYEIQNYVNDVYSQRCGLPDYEYVYNSRNSNPVIPFVKKASL